MMIKDIIEDTFAKKSTDACELSILIGMDSFDYMVLDEQRQVRALRAHALGGGGARLAAVQAVHQADAFLHQSFKRIRVGVASPKNTLVPERLFDETEKEAYLRQVVELEAADSVQVDPLPSLSLRQVYALPRALVDFVRQAFPAAQLVHQTTALLQGYQAAVPASGHTVIAHLRGNWMYLAVFEGGQLVFANSFSFKTAKDFIYYLLLIYQQLELNPEEQPLGFSGQLLENSEIHREAYRYIRHLQFWEAPAGIQFGPRLRQEPPHLYYDLLSLSLL
jgi:hypothetical protein